MDIFLSLSSLNYNLAGVIFDYAGFGLIYSNFSFFRSTKDRYLLMFLSGVILRDFVRLSSFIVAVRKYVVRAVFGVNGAYPRYWLYFGISSWVGFFGIFAEFVKLRFVFSFLEATRFIKSTSSVLLFGVFIITFYSIIYFLFLEAGQKLKEIIFFTNKSQEKSGSLNIIKKESCFSKYRIIIFRNDAQQLYKERR